MGVSGVQAVPKTLHSHGLITPFSTSPHWHALGSATRTPGISCTHLRIEVRELASQLQSALRYEPETSPLEMGPELEHLSQDRESLGVSLLADHARVLVLDLASSLGDLVKQHCYRVEDVEGLEPCSHQGLAVLGRYESIGPLPDDGGDVARAEKAVETQIR